MNLLFRFKNKFFILQEISIEQEQFDPLKASSHNKNNWAWTEKDYTKYAEQKLKEIYNFTETIDKYNITVSTTSIKGEAFKYVRKNRLHLSYDFVIKMNVEVTIDDKKVKFTAQYEPFVDDEPEDWDYELQAKVEDFEYKKQLMPILNKEYFNKKFVAFKEDFEKQE